MIFELNLLISYSRTSQGKKKSCCKQSYVTVSTKVYLISVVFLIVVTLVVSDFLITKLEINPGIETKIRTCTNEKYCSEVNLVTCEQGLF